MSLRISLETRCGNRWGKKVGLYEDSMNSTHNLPANPMIGLDLGQLHPRISLRDDRRRESGDRNL